MLKVKLKMTAGPTVLESGRASRRAASGASRDRRGLDRRLARHWIAAVLCTVGCHHESDSVEAQFRRSVVPVLERHCASGVCHGVEPAALERGDVVDWDLLVFEIDDAGKILDLEQAYEASKRTINTVEDPEFSGLLRKPLAMESGGLPHYGRASFATIDDLDYRALYDWIERETGGGEDPEPLDDLQQHFADTVQPTLVDATCMISACHGKTSGGTPYRLDEGYQGRFSAAATRTNYEASLRMLSLDGHPMQSRLLAKSLPLTGHGVIHKGTNLDFFAANPRGVDDIVTWICKEREARTGHDCAKEDDSPISALVFVGGVLEPRTAFDLGTFVPGRDLFIARIEGEELDVIEIENLTGGFHDDPVDIRDPTVSADGRRVAFAMRTRADRGHRIYELDLETRDLLQRTFDPEPLEDGGIATDRDPVWGVDDELWFVSTRAGTLGDRGSELDADIYSIGPDVTSPRRWTWTRHIERKLTFFRIGQGSAAELAFSALRETIPGQARAHIFRFPPSLHTEYHQHFGVNSVQDLIFDMRQLPNGRFVTVVGDLDTRFRAGGLAVVDRNFGPELDPGGDPDRTGLPSGYAPPLVVLEGEEVPEADQRVVYRDPAPLPDGRIVVTRVLESPADERALSVRIDLLTLGEDPDGGGPYVVERRALLQAPDAGEDIGYMDPEPVFVAAPVRLAKPHHRETEDDTGLFYHQGMPMIDAILGRLEPAGTKRPPTNFRHVRIVEAFEETPSTRHEIPVEDTRHQISGATNTSLSSHSPAQILGELPLAADGSFQARLPARVSFRLEALDEDQMMVGTVHNRWYHLAPGQKVIQGVSTLIGMAHYNSQCAACHGADDGDGFTAFETVDLDMITGASLSLSRYEHQDPRRPIEAPSHGDDTRRSIDFRRDVQPILSTRCATNGCHDAASMAGGFSLSDAATPWFTDAYESLLAPGTGSENGAAYVDHAEGRARTSFLMEKILGRELEAPRTLTTPGQRHPEQDHGHTGPTQEEILTLIRWIELGATFEGLPPSERDR